MYPLSQRPFLAGVIYRAKRDHQVVLGHRVPLLRPSGEFGIWSLGMFKIDVNVRYIFDRPSPVLRLSRAKRDVWTEK